MTDFNICRLKANCLYSGRFEKRFLWILENLDKLLQCNGMVSNMIKCYSGREFMRTRVVMFEMQQKQRSSSWIGIFFYMLCILLTSHRLASFLAMLFLCSSVSTDSGYRKRTQIKTRNVLLWWNTQFS